MTNKKVVAAVLGVMCFLLTLGIFVQIKTVKNNNSTVSNNYEENSLRAEVLKYKEKYDNKYKELEKAGRIRKEDEIDPAVGIVLEKKIGDIVQKDEPIAYIHANDLEKLQIAKENLSKTIKIRKEQAEKTKTIIKIIEDK